MNRRVFPVMMVLLFLLLAATSTRPCFAESIDYGGGVMAPVFEPRPDLGIPAGAFMVFPTLTAGTTYNDNVYATKHDKVSDWIATIAPRVMALSTWSCHSLKLDAGLKKGFHLDESDENYLNAHVLAGGRLNMLRTSYFELKTGYEHYYEDRGSPEALEAWEEPGRYERLSADGSFHHESGRFTIDTGGGAAGYFYKDVDLMDGTTLSQDIRDYNSYDVNLRVGYEWMHDVQPFIKADYNWRRYDKKDEAQRDSDGYRIGAGTKIYMGGIVTGDVWGGYMSQEYDFDNREDISSIWYGLGITWDVTRLTSLRASVQRTVDETNQAGASGNVATMSDLTIRHAFLRHLTGSLGLSYNHHDYEGIDITDKYYIINPVISYRMNRNLTANLGYKYIERNGSDRFEYENERDYAANQITVSITAAF